MKRLVNRNLCSIKLNE